MQVYSAFLSDKKSKQGDESAKGRVGEIISNGEGLAVWRVLGGGPSRGIFRKEKTKNL